MFAWVPDQVIVNEYLPGQGIAPHVDSRAFGSAVATVSLGDAWHMDMKPVRRPDRAGTVSLLLERGSALVMTGDARYVWAHGIARRKQERDERGLRPRRRRVSLTFRTVIQDGDRVA